MARTTVPASQRTGHPRQSSRETAPQCGMDTSAAVSPLPLETPRCASAILEALACMKGKAHTVTARYERDYSEGFAHTIVVRFDQNMGGCSAALVIDARAQWGAAFNLVSATLQAIEGSD